MSDQLRNRAGALRRQFLAAVTTATVTATAGCSALTNWAFDQFLESVNVLNETDSPVQGQIEITDPAATVVLAEQFDLVSTDAVDDDDRGNMAFYEDVWTTDGSYEVSVELTDTEIEGTGSVTESVAVDDSAEEMLLVALGADEFDEPIEFRVGEAFSEIFDDS